MPDSSFPFVYSDGGRSASKRPRQKLDCTVRALALARGIDYDVAYDILAEAGRGCSKRFDFSTWIKRQNFAVKISFPAVKGHPRMNPVRFSQEFPQGTYIVTVAKHIFVFINGVAFDIEKERDDRCIYTAFKVEELF